MRELDAEVTKPDFVELRSNDQLTTQQALKAWSDWDKAGRPMGPVTVRSIPDGWCPNCGEKLTASRERHLISGKIFCDLPLPGQCEGVSPHEPHTITEEVSCPGVPWPIHETSLEPWGSLTICNPGCYIAHL